MPIKLPERHLFSSNQVVRLRIMDVDNSRNVNITPIIRSYKYSTYGGINMSTLRNNLTQVFNNLCKIKPRVLYKPYDGYDSHYINQSEWDEIKKECMNITYGDSIYDMLISLRKTEGDEQNWFFSSRLVDHSNLIFTSDKDVLLGIKGLTIPNTNRYLYSCGTAKWGFNGIKTLKSLGLTIPGVTDRTYDSLLSHKENDLTKLKGVYGVNYIKGISYADKKKNFEEVIKFIESSCNIKLFEQKGSSIIATKNLPNICRIDIHTLLVAIRNEAHNNILFLLKDITDPDMFHDSYIISCVTSWHAPAMGRQVAKIINNKKGLWKVQAVGNSDTGKEIPIRYKLYKGHIKRRDIYG